MPRVHRITEAQAQRNLNKVVSNYRRMFGFDLSYMRLILDEKPHYRDGSVVPGKPKGWNAGSATNGGIIYINPDIESVFSFYDMPRSTSPDTFNLHMIAHELAHEIYLEHATSAFIRKMISDARCSRFNTPYLETVPDNKYDEELFCEWLAALVTGEV